MPAKSIYTTDSYEACLARIGKLSADTKAQWGTMDSAQMLAHCAEIQEVSNGKALQGTPLIIKLLRGMIRKKVLAPGSYSRSIKTHPQYEQGAPRDFAAEKRRLLESLTLAREHHSQGVAEPDHPLFGKMTSEEKGWVTYKHLNHHLTQFGV